MAGSSNTLRSVLKELGWSRTRLVAELRRQAAGSGDTLPGTESLLAMVSRWVNNHQQPSDFYRDLLAQTLGRPRANHIQSVVYLLHFDRPYRHASHYTGWVHSRSFLQPRLGAHRDGAGARLMQVVGEAGIGFQLARTWDGDRHRERALKRQGGASRRCPICRAERRRRR